MPRAKKAKIGASVTEAIAVEEEKREEIPAIINENNEALLENNEGELVVDVFEDDKDFVVMAAVAGVSPKDVEIQVDKDMLLIKGCRSNPDNKKNKNYFYQECHWGLFSRKVVLPENVDGGKIQAEFDKGILTVRVPRIARESNGQKNISVKEG
jgi:HSP20 family molecular chaperone IbpA